MKKLVVILSSFVIVIGLFAGCSSTPSTTVTPTAAPGADVLTTASVVKDNTAFEGAISSKGTWIIATLNDLTFTKDLVLDGDFVNGKKDENGKDIIQRKIALYSQDANRVVTARFTLTAPKLTVNSPNASIQSGTFVGDIDVNALNFQLVDAKVTGNIYFANDAAKKTFTMNATSSVSGTQTLK